MSEYLAKYYAKANKKKILSKIYTQEGFAGVLELIKMLKLPVVNIVINCLDSKIIDDTNAQLFFGSPLFKELTLRNPDEAEELVNFNNSFNFKHFEEVILKFPHEAKKLLRIRCDLTAAQYLLDTHDDFDNL